MTAPTLATLVVFIIINSLYHTSDATPAISCPVTYVKRGCYNDNTLDRRMPEMLGSGRNNGLEPGWGNWNLFIPGFVCKCADQAMKKGYRYFGIQFYAECWSGNVTASRVESLGSSEQGCVATDFSGPCKDDSALCVGKASKNYVYEIQIPTTKPPAMDCKDKLVRCEEYASNGLCTDKYPSVLEYCPFSCKRCSTP